MENKKDPLVLCCCCSVNLYYIALYSAAWRCLMIINKKLSCSLYQKTIFCLFLYWSHQWSGLLNNSMFIKIPLALVLFSTGFYKRIPQEVITGPKSPCKVLTPLTVCQFCIPPLENTSVMSFIKAPKLFLHLLKCLFAMTESPYNSCSF